MLPNSHQVFFRTLYTPSWWNAFRARRLMLKLKTAAAYPGLNTTVGQPWPAQPAGVEWYITYKVVGGFLD